MLAGLVRQQGRPVTEAVTAWMILLLRGGALLSRSLHSFSRKVSHVRPTVSHVRLVLPSMFEPCCEHEEDLPQKMY